MNKIVFLLIYFLSANLYGSSYEEYAFTSVKDKQRFNALIKEIRCIVCQNQNLAESNAPIANDLRNKIYHMILEQQTNDVIKNYLVKRYGEFILLRPRIHIKTIFLWVFPLFAFGLAGTFLYRFKRNSMHKA